MLAKRTVAVVNVEAAAAARLLQLRGVIVRLAAVGHLLRGVPVPEAAGALGGRRLREDVFPDQPVLRPLRECHAIRCPEPV